MLCTKTYLTLSFPIISYKKNHYTAFEFLPRLSLTADFLDVCVVGLFGGPYANYEMEAC